MTAAAAPLAPNAPPETIAWFRAASSYLHRDDLRCPEHGVAHTGKLARAIVLDLGLFDATGDETFWQRAVRRAEYVLARAGPDPEHGALIYLPGRLDPRNCSNSVIDSGECSDALTRLLAHPRAASLDTSLAARLRAAVLENAESYLRTAVVEKEITNQRLWGAMGLASVYTLEPRAEWAMALRESLAKSIGEQRADGSWGYQPEAVRDGAFAGAADLTVYYHGRCLAFLMHVLERVPEADPDGRVRDAIRRGLRFLAACILPDGLKPLALEGKRWFWGGEYEVGSNAYDIFALLRGAEWFNVPEWRHLALASWAQFSRHQRRNGAILASGSRRLTPDFVCPDFHTADLAWTLQVMTELPPPASNSLPKVARGAAPVNAHMTDVTPSVTVFEDAGVVRLDSPRGAALIRTRKLAANTQFGGWLGGGALAGAADSDGTTLHRGVLEGPRAAGSFTVYPHPARKAATGALRRFLRNNHPGREGRQLAFVGRLLLTAGTPLAAAARVWQGFGAPLVEALRDPVAVHWALNSLLEAQGAACTCTAQVARPDGSVPGWAEGIRGVHRYEVDATGLRVTDRLARDVPQLGEQPQRIEYVVPPAATQVGVRHEGMTVSRRGLRIAGSDLGGTFSLEITYRL